MKPLRCEFFPVKVMYIDEEAEFDRHALRLNLGVYPQPFSGMTYYVPDDEDGALIVVALGDCSGMSPFEADLILVHEAVHVMQFTFELIGEKSPGVEIEAYAVQYFSKYLISESCRRKYQRSLTAKRKRAMVGTKSKRRTT